MLGERQRGVAGGKAGPGRGNKTVSNGNRLSGGNNTNYTLARLHRDRPDLAAKVVAGEISAHAAVTCRAWCFIEHVRTPVLC